MIVAILRAARRLDKTLESRLGRPYRAVLSVGLVFSIVQQINALSNASRSGTGILRASIAIVFGICLLVNQMGELSARLEQRRRAIRS
jgi:hypothetical protein